MRRKWSPSSKAFALLGVVLALISFVIVNGYANRARALGAALGRTAPVTVAAQDLHRGEVLSSSVLKVVQFPEAFAPPGSVPDVGSASGKVLVSDVGEGEPITHTRIAEERAGPVAAVVPEGLRAFVIPSDLPGGSLRSGDRVDVLATFGGGQPHTETVVSGVEVLFVNQSGGGGGGSGASDAASVLTLLVSPDQAEQLAYAQAFAALTLSIVGPEEVVET
jgi:pilus assembly protein CpaB